MGKLFILVIIALVGGCASLPPTIDQGEYQNYRYGFIVELPRDGWERTNAVPGPFAGHFVPEAPNRLLLLLHNPQRRLLRQHLRLLWWKMLSMATVRLENMASADQASPMSATVLKDCRCCTARVTA